MAEYIERDKLLDEMKYHRNTVELVFEDDGDPMNAAYLDGFEAAMRMVRRAASENVERVTYCKNCNHWAPLPSCPTLGRCTFMRNGLQTGAEYFCASAVRKEERDRETN